MAGKFLLRKSGTQFYFNLIAGNSETILTSERYIQKESAKAGITSVKANAPYDNRYDRRRSVANQPYFVLKGGNGEVIGTSEMYSSTTAMETGIASVKSNAPSAPVDDLT